MDNVSQTVLAASIKACTASIEAHMPLDDANAARLSAVYAVLADIQQQAAGIPAPQSTLEPVDMTPAQKLKWAILVRAAELEGAEQPAVTPDNVDDCYEDLMDRDIYWDAKEEVRCGGEDTGLATIYDRHYEVDDVAAQMPDGTWVAWPYYYGGGKHGEPSACEWLDKAYAVNCKEELRLANVRTFTKA